MSATVFFLTKIFVSALVIAIVTEVAKLSDKWGGLIAALPTTTFLILLWMYFEGASDDKIARHVGFTMYFVLPTLPLFFALPFIINKFGFWPAFVRQYFADRAFGLSIQYALRALWGEYTLRLIKEWRI